MNQKRVLLQAFEWYLPADHQHYQHLMGELSNLHEAGIDDLWLAPPTKAMQPDDVGYGIYDLYDLGEFDQKGSVATKYGTLDELKQLIVQAHQLGMHVYLDTVLNHKAGADETETFSAVQVDAHDRTQDISEPHDIEGWTRFTFPNRKGAYSQFVWNFNHFTGVDFDQKTGTKGVFRIVGENKYWNQEVSDEQGNFDYLMFADIDHNHPDVQAELDRWGLWVMEKTGADGMRLDALKHISADFIAGFIKRLQEQADRPLYFVGEYWSGDAQKKQNYIEHLRYRTDLFDVGLHYNFHQASLADESYDMRTIFDNTLIQFDPTVSVSFVDNHDTQKGQALASWVEPWFKPLAYALILLRNEGYPCIFWGDYYGVVNDPDDPGLGETLRILLNVRRNSGFVSQEDYFTDPNVLGWVVRDPDKVEDTFVVVMNNSFQTRTCQMHVPPQTTFTRVLGEVDASITSNQEGVADFPVAARGVSVWVAKIS